MATISPLVFDPSNTTITMDNIYITGIGETAISFEYSQDAVSAAAGLDGAVVVEVNNAQLGTCSLPMKIASPQFEKMMKYARNHTQFSIWATDKSAHRKAGGTAAFFTRVPSISFDSSDVTFDILIPNLEITTC